MPQADISIISSTVFFLFFSFLIGYFVWVNLIFPRIVTLVRVKEISKSIKEKNFLNNDEISLRSSPKKYFDRFSFLYIFSISDVLDLPSDEIPLLVNFILISLSFYFVLSNMLVNSHNESQNFINSISKFDFADNIKESNISKLNASKYLRSSLLLNIYKIANNWIEKRDMLLINSLKNNVSLSSLSFLGDLKNIRSSKKTNKIKKVFKGLNRLFIFNKKGLKKKFKLK